MEATFLMLCAAEGNHNKYYFLEPQGNVVVCRYGRYTGGDISNVVAVKNLRGVSKTYPISEFYNKVNEKLRKGYIRVPLSPVSSVTSTYAPEKDARVQELLDELLRASDKFLKRTYSVDCASVSQESIESALGQISSLREIEDDVEYFNGLLEILYSTIPRNMKKVSDFLAKSPEDFDEILTREESGLDVLKKRVKQAAKREKSQGKTFCETHGTSISVVEDEKCLSQIKKHLRGCELLEAFEVY